MTSPREYLIELNTNNINHTGRSFYEHLCNVEDILKICKCEDYVCLAGLYHSIYGTNYFNANLDTSREKIKEIIGDKAENLAWIFCNAKRPFCWFCGNHIVLQDGSHISVDNKTLHDLQMIESANLLEQHLGADLIVSFSSKAI
jgi:hypothetical protein